MIQTLYDMFVYGVVVCTWKNIMWMPDSRAQFHHISSIIEIFIERHQLHINVNSEKREQRANEVSCDRNQFFLFSCKWFRGLFEFIWFHSTINSPLLLECHFFVISLILSFACALSDVCAKFIKCEVTHAYIVKSVLLALDITSVHTRWSHGQSKLARTHTSEYHIF